VAALQLVEDCVLRLDDPVDPWLPELADRRVMRDPRGSTEDVEPARRAITLRDLLTFRLGVGFDFAAGSPQPLMARMADLEVGPGPPAPGSGPGPDEWMRRLGTLPLERQPGERWLYHTGSEVLGVLLARASGLALDELLAERIFGPLGMVDTGFHVPAGSLDRFGACHFTDPGTGERSVFDARDGQWSSPPAFPSAGGGLVSTVGDFLRFARMLLAGGIAGGADGAEGRILSRSAVAAMTIDQLTAEQRAAGGPAPDGSVGWGFGVGVQVVRTGPSRSVGSYGWDGGLGSTWANDPTEDLVGVLLTNEMWTSPVPPPVCTDFWTCAYAALG
jgi:CubicO group peptidase (beta-lactamase class C family)